VRFDPRRKWDGTIPGQLFGLIKDTFSERSELHETEVEIGSSGVATATRITPAASRVRLRKADGSAMVQVGRHLLVVNQLRPYSDWESFREMILSVHEKHRSVWDPGSPVQLGLRYINRLDVPDGTFDIADRLTLDPPLRGPLDRRMNSFYQRYELAHDDPQGVLVHQTGLAVIDEKKGLMLDLDFVSNRVSSSLAIRDWLDAAHDRIEEAFIASLAPEFYRKLKDGRQ
jgi:uncharacterized protein (TIGR04255 family)